MLKEMAWDQLGEEPEQGSEGCDAYQARQEALMQVLAEYGVRPSKSHERMFSNPNSPVKAPTQPDDMDVTPDRVGQPREAAPQPGAGAGVLPQVRPLRRTGAVPEPSTGTTQELDAGKLGNLFDKQNQVFEGADDETR